MSSFKKIKKDAAISLIRMLTDYKLYNSMMSREINLRDLDLSSVTRHHNYKNYIKRLKSKGDKLIPKKIKIGVIKNPPPIPSIPVKRPTIVLIKSNNGAFINTSAIGR